MDPLNFTGGVSPQSGSVVVPNRGISNVFQPPSRQKFKEKMEEELKKFKEDLKKIIIGEALSPFRRELKQIREELDDNEHQTDLVVGNFTTKPQLLRWCKRKGRSEKVDPVDYYYYHSLEMDMLLGFSMLMVKKSLLMETTTVVENC